MDGKNILIQGIGFVGTLLFFASFQCRKNKNLFRVQFLSYLFYTAHLFCLGAYTGAISYVLNTVRSLCLGSSCGLVKSRKACLAICLLQLATLVFTREGWISVLPVAANIASTIGGYTNSPRKIRIAGMFFNSPLWMVYNIIVHSWAGVLDEVVSEASMIVSIVRFGWKNLDSNEKEEKTV